MPAISLHLDDINFLSNTNDIQNKCNPQACVSHEASSNKTLNYNYNIVRMNHIQMEQDLEQSSLNLSPHMSLRDTAQQCVCITRFQQNYRRSVSDQLALAANVRLRKDRSYIWYGNVQQLKDFRFMFSIELNLH